MSKQQTNNVGTVFITGPSASGKTTLGNQLKLTLNNIGINNVVLLDGEEVRKEMAKSNIHYGYSTEERNTYSIKLAELALNHNRNGVTCIICAISHIKKTREKVREIVGNLMEVYLCCPIDVCAKRDYKGHYKKAFAGELDNFIGVTEPYELSEKPELILDTENLSIEKCSHMLLQHTLFFLNNGKP